MNIHAKSQFKKHTARKKHPVTDHAVVRWMERVYGLDVDAVRDHILTPDLKTALRMGATRAVIDGVEYALGNGTVITVNRTVGDDE